MNILDNSKYSHLLKRQPFYHRIGKTLLYNWAKFIFASPFHGRPTYLTVTPKVTVQMRSLGDLPSDSISIVAIPVQVIGEWVASRAHLVTC